MKWGLQGVILDLDGTLFDTLRPQYEFHKLVATHPEIGRMKSFPEFTPEWITEYNRIYAEQGLKGLYNRYGEINFDRDYDRIQAEYATFNQHHTILPCSVDGDDMGTVVKELWRRGSLTSSKNNRLRLAVNTTKEKANVISLLTRNNLLEYFDCCVSIDDVFYHAGNGLGKRLQDVPKDISALRKAVPQDLVKLLEKPNSLSSMLTIMRLGTSPERLIAVEDTPSGVGAYKNINMPEGFADIYTIGVTWGFEPNPEVLRQAGADEIITKPSQLLSIVERFGGFS